MAEELTIAAVLEYYGARTIPAGVGWRSMRCPFHADSVASASVNHGRDLFVCHTCGVKGSPLRIIQQVEKKDSEAASEFARCVLGKSIQAISRPTSRSKKRRPMGRERFAKILG